MRTWIGGLAGSCMLLAATSGLACEPPASGSLAIGSFNVKWVGYYDEERDNDGLAELLKDCAVVLIQELVAPPDLATIGLPVNWRKDLGATYPDGSPLRHDPAATAFFAAMQKRGFSYVLSEEDTGPGDKQFLNSPATEWFVAFYKPALVCTPWDGEACKGLTTGGFLARDRTASPYYDRVPYAFSFRALEGAGPGKPRNDFILVSVHLRPDGGSGPSARRRQELASIDVWAKQLEATGEADVLIVGDTNIQSCTELGKALPVGWASLNDECRDTVPSKADRPYDHVLYRPALTKEIDHQFDFRVLDLVQRMEARWVSVGNGAYPGRPYKSKVFPKYFSDHHPVHFRLLVIQDDDALMN